MIFKAEVTKAFIRYFTTRTAAAQFKRAELKKKAPTRINLAKPPAVKQKTGAIIVPAGVKITVCESPKYERLDLSSIMRDCKMGSPRRTCHVTKQDVLEVIS